MKKAVLETVLIYSSKERSGSRVTPRSFTVLFETTVRLIVRFNRRSIYLLGPRTSISVLSEFKSKTFAVIHFLMSETQASREGNFGASNFGASLGFIEMYSCVHPHSSESKHYVFEWHHQEVKYIVKTIVVPKRSLEEHRYLQLICQKTNHPQRQSFWQIRSKPVQNLSV